MAEQSTVETPRVCVLTPAGRGAIAVVAVGGVGSVEAVDQFFHAASGKSLAEMPVRRVAFGQWGGADGEEVVVTRGDDSVEVHCHGGVAASRAIGESLKSVGCEVIDQPVWLGENTAGSIEVAAHRALAQVVTEREALVLLDQINGALRQALEQAVQLIDSGQFGEAKERMFTVANRWHGCNPFIQPTQIYVMGAPNVGKSSLINALVGFERAIVFDAPGTTRDLVTTTTAIDGWTVELVDTAGLRQGADSIEQQGIDLAFDSLHGAKLVLHVAEARTWLEGEPSTNVFLDRLKGIPLIRVANKIDLLGPSEMQKLEKRASDKFFLTSTVHRQGIDELLEAIGATVNPPPLPAGTAVLLNQEQTTKVTEALAATAAEAKQALQSLLAK